MHTSGFLWEYIINLLHNDLLLTIFKKQVESVSHLHHFSHFYTQNQIFVQNSSEAQYVFYIVREVTIMFGWLLLFVCAGKDFIDKCLEKM